MPGLYRGLMEIGAALEMPELDGLIRKVYNEQENISIDYGVLERSERVLIIPADIGWSDVGDWSALDAILERDEEGNIIQAEHRGIGTRNSIIYGEDKDRLIATIGLENIVIAETEGALLVMDKSGSQDVREIVRRIRTKRGEQ
jgi:mannose-1-phosphate guanylyltransferase